MAMTKPEDDNGRNQPRSIQAINVFATAMDAASGIGLRFKKRDRHIPLELHEYSAISLL